MGLKISGRNEEEAGSGKKNMNANLNAAFCEQRGVNVDIFDRVDVIFLLQKRSKFSQKILCCWKIEDNVELMCFDEYSPVSFSCF